MQNTIKKLPRYHYKIVYFNLLSLILNLLDMLIKFNSVISKKYFETYHFIMSLQGRV